MIHELHQLLEAAAERLRRLRLWHSLAACWFIWAAIGAAGALAATRYRWTWPDALGWLVAAALVTAFACWRWAHRAARDPRQVARKVEARYPELGALLLAALEQAPAPRFRRLGYLESTVVRGAVQHGRTHNWADAIPRGRLWAARLVHLAALAALVGACVLLFDRTGAHARLNPVGAEPAAARGGDYDLKVEPGDAEIERGTTLVVIAKFAGPVPSEARLVVTQDRAAGVKSARPQSPAEDSGGDEAVDPSHPEKTATTAHYSRAMTRSLDDPQFVGRVAAVDQPLVYSIEYAGQKSAEYRISVFDYPELVRVDAQLDYPAFTRLEPKLVEDVRQLTAVAGTRVTLRFRLNKSVADARLVDRSGEERELVRAAGDEPVYETALTLGESRRLKLHLVDDAGRKNKLPPELVLNATANRPADVKVTRPGRDVQASALEEFEVGATATDDFGLVDYGVSYSIGGGEPHDISLRTSGDDDAAPSASSKHEALSHVIDLESLDAEPDQLVSYYFWADDFGPDDQPRRTRSDMYFAEVRRFDEIFRQGQQPTDQQMQQQAQQMGGAGQQVEQLAELQKQITAATWKLIRREAGDKPTPTFSDDARVVRQSQEQAIEQLQALAGQMNDAGAARLAAAAGQHMERAVEQLGEAANAPDAAPLPAALSAEQAAYQSLLKLRARQTDVVRSASGQQGGQGGASGAGQRQLQQLELSSDENRYETQSRAESQRDPRAQQRLDESRKLLDRLRQLGRRQEDLNERLREAQAALQAAATDAERREIERQLKRLREQQREILRDADALQSDLASSESREQNQSARDQLDEARQRVQDASEALDEGRLAEAVTEGARAGRQLNQLRDEVRRQTADRFTDEMRDLRNQARELNQRQQELSEQLAQENSAAQKSLRDSGERDQVRQGLAEQQERLGETLKRIERTVEEAEEPEPLLARELYEAADQLARQKTEQALEAARQMAEAGATREAGEAMRHADRGVQELSERIDRAAQSVLGDETEALRRANERLSELADELGEEIERAQGRQQNQVDSSDAPLQGEGTGGEGEAGEETGTSADASGSPPSAEGGMGLRDADDPQSPDESRGEPSESANSDPSGPLPSAGRDGEGGSSEDGSSARGHSPLPNSPPQGEGTGSEGEGEADAGEASGRSGRGEMNLQDIFGGGAAGPGGPVTGEGFRQWSQRMRDVEDMLGDPELAAQAARIRDRVEEVRRDYKRHSRLPDWNKLQTLVAEPLVELRQRIDQEISRRESPDALAPIDRDAAPAEFTEQVRRYYQRLGAGQ